MKYGLATEDLKRINEVFAAHPAVSQVIIFGSRAMNTYKHGSDIDLAIKGSSLKFNDILQLHRELEELGILFTFDIRRYENIKDPEVLAHIQRVGKELYLKH